MALLMLHERKRSRKYSMRRLFRIFWRLKGLEFRMIYPVYAYIGLSLDSFALLLDNFGDVIARFLALFGLQELVRARLISVVATGGRFRSLLDEGHRVPLERPLLAVWSFNVTVGTRLLILLGRLLFIISIHL